MSKRNKILLSVLIVVYIIALVVFHSTYEYTTYWEEESSIVIQYSFFYIIIGLILYCAFNWKALKSYNSSLTIKGATKVVAYTSVLKAIISISSLFLDRYIYDYVEPIIITVCWIVISTFFFTLHKNML